MSISFVIHFKIKMFVKISRMDGANFLHRRNDAVARSSAQLPGKGHLFVLTHSFNLFLNSRILFITSKVTRLDISVRICQIRLVFFYNINSLAQKGVSNFISLKNLKTESKFQFFDLLLFKYFITMQHFLRLVM
jgi:hypothetical protein